MNSSLQRIRAQFSKQGNLRFIGHLDLQRLFERALRRSALPLRYSQGFNPKVRLNLASALPLGFSSRHELLDFWLDEPKNLAEIQTELQKALPADINILSLWEVPNANSSLQGALRSSEFEISFPSNYSLENLQLALQSLLDQPSLTVERRGKTQLLQSIVEKVTWLESPEGNILRVQMCATPACNGRPDDLLKLMGIDPAECKIERSNLFFATE